jgi:ankyrin repeat protein
MQIAFQAAATGDLIDLARAIEVCGVNKQDFDGRSILHIACCEGQLKTVEYLINQRADINTFDRRGNEPLADAMLNGHRQVALILIKAGARLSHESDLNLQHRMCQLAAAGDTAKFQAMVAGGVSVNSKNYDRRSALHLAACGGHLELVHLIIANGGNVCCRDRWGRTPMADAIGEGHAEVQEALRLANWLTDVLSDSECCSESGSITEILDSAGPSSSRSPPRARPASRRTPRRRGSLGQVPAWPAPGPPEPDAHRFTAHCVQQVGPTCARSRAYARSHTLTRARAHAHTHAHARARAHMHSPRALTHARACGR